MASKSGKREDFDSFAEDLLAERATRPLVIVGASRVDDLLVEVLRGFLMPKIAKPREKDELLEAGSAPLTTFSSRIKLCRRLGLIDETLFFALEKLRAIRNDSAHKVRFDKEKSPTSEHFRDLKGFVIGRDSYRLTRERYFGNAQLREAEEWQCVLLTLCLLLEAIRDTVRKTRGSKKALHIAAK